MTDIKKLFKEHKPKFHISTDDETNYKQLYEQQKLRADELQKQLNEKSEGNKSLLNIIDELTTVIEELHISNSGFCEQTELSKLRVDQLEKRWSELKERMEHDEKEAFGEGDVIAHTVHNYVLELMHDLEEDGE